MKIIVHGQNVELTEATILATRKYYADNAQKCIDNAISGEDRVNDLDRYITWRNKQIADGLAGLNDHTFTFVQMAYYIQSGESVPLLN